MFVNDLMVHILSLRWSFWGGFGIKDEKVREKMRQAMELGSTAGVKMRQAGKVVL